MIALVLFTSLAHASLVYPGTLQEAAGVECVPLCTVCHDSMAGGAGTVVTPFGVAMSDAGLTGGSQFELLLDLYDSAAFDLDSDGDGLSDAEELAAGYDPNPGDAAFCDVLAPTYGCFSHTNAAPAAILALFGALVASRRRR